MHSKSIHTFGALIWAACGLNGICADTPELSVTMGPDPTGAFPASTLVTATLKNRFSRAIALEAVQMPGGYVGSGEFFNCSLERRVKPNDGWQVAINTRLKDFGQPTVRSINLREGEEREVCRQMLPTKGVSPNSCLRFRLRFSWDPTASTSVVSEPFVLSTGSPKHCP